MAGGSGDDTYIADNAGGLLIELSPAGNDNVKTGVSYTLQVNTSMKVLQANNAAATTARSPDWH